MLARNPRLAALLVALQGLSACAPGDPGRPPSSPRGQTEPPSRPRGAPTPDEPEPAPPQPEPAELAEAVAPPAACPDDMLLVEGDYCEEVEQRCVQSWYAKANRKQVCERFEPPSRCVSDVTRKRFCIDRYAWPNRKGERPEVMNTFYQAQVKCAAVGKRTCTESEWTFACEGPEMKPFPYGYVRDPNKCNGDRPWDNPDMKKVARRDPRELGRLWQGVRSGHQPQCVSDFGVHDLPGNTDEVVASENFSNTWRGRYDSVNTGGPWYLGVRNQCRPKIYSHAEGFYYYFLSFRCCSEPDGVPTDPRTPKQVAKDRPFGYVERLAGFDVEAMRKKLKLKAQGKCSCPERDVLCKTMCGTLLGSNAEDVIPKPVEESESVEP